MQTFAPLPEFWASAAVLDRQRLGKQRVEAKQILRALRGETRGWVHHPATKMWRGHEGALAEYGIAVCREWRSRGYQDSLQPYFEGLLLEYPDTSKPAWWGLYRFHLAHQSVLVRKLPEHYGPRFPDAPEGLDYWWPV